MENPEPLQNNKIERFKIESKAESLGKFFNLSPEIVERGKQTRVLFVSKDEMIKQAAEYTRALSEAVKNNSLDSAADAFIKEYLPDLHREEFWDRDVEATTSQDLKNTRGIFIVGTGQRSIYIDKNEKLPNFDEDLSHETLHSLSSKGFGQREGLKLACRGGVFAERLNEAATEVLREFARRQWSIDLPPNLSQIRDAHINENYQESAILLMTSMTLTSLSGGKPVTIRDLASYYFDINDKKGKGPIYFFNELTSSVPQQYIDRVTTLAFERLF